MELRRRFVFRGNAAAIGGRIVRPADTILDSVVASSLTVAGGRSRARAGPARFGEFVSFASAATSAEGLFDSLQGQIDRTFGRIPEDYLTTTTRVSADVTGLSIGGDKPKLTIKHLHASMTSKSPAGSGETSVVPGNDTVIDGVSIDGHVLTIELALPVFQQHDTMSKLLAAADNPQFVKESGDLLYMTPTAAGTAPPTAPGTVPPPAPPARLQYCSGTVYATIVKSIKWAGEPINGAVIDQNSVFIPDLGKLFFGELLITSESRRLTLLRGELGSVVGGDVACAEADPDGTWST
jgi:hypothetical protein